MKKIIYFIHVPWAWIKQRPHFLAEKISKYYEIEVLQNKVFNFKIEKVENKTDLKVSTIFRLPFLRYKLINNINCFFSKILLKNKMKKFEYIFLLYPTQYQNINKEKKQKLVYDCMDDHYAMNKKKNKSYSKNILKQEEKLLKIADLVIFSSEYLKNTILSRYNLENVNYIILNNGINLYEKNNRTEKKSYYENNNLKKITYIGTIGEWFDIELLLKCLNKFKNIEFNIFGPSEIKLPEHERLKVRGVIEHQEIQEVMEQSDALIMPFILNDIVLSVNPVKAYEYISAKKPIFLVNYGETKKFEEYVYLYDGYDDLSQFLVRLENDELEFKGQNKNIEEYLRENTWDARVKKLIQEIEKL